MRLTSRTGVLFAAIILLLDLGIGHGAITLDALGNYLTKNGYGGAQLVQLGNFFHLPIQSSGKPANLVVDTGSPSTLIFRSSLKGLNLNESTTAELVHGAFGRGRDVYGLTTIKTLSAGNCTLTNVPVAVASGSADTAFSRAHSNGLLGLRELIRFGGVLDLRNHLVYLRPSRPGNSVGPGIKSILSGQGYTAVPLLLKGHHVLVSGALNGFPCYFIVDTGGYVTTLDVDFAARTKLKVATTRLVAQGLSGSSSVGITTFPSLRIGNYEIQNGSASVVRFNPEILGSHSLVAGIIGVEYLSINRAIFDFVSGTMYLRPR
ncbi:MAG TPA: retropepsin-like aspartic protease [Candidatus Udaeobacter sp.]|jgi:predicted aspartyl protease